jgi:ElaB/YqjD/DUF883 family membrane-anchored ribosome-binding protein
MDTNEQNLQTQDQGRSGGRAEDMRRRAIEAYDGARGSVAQAGRRATDGIDEAPLIALGAGFAVGALVAALLPRTQTEAEMLRPMSRKLTDNARTAVDAAREAGSNRLRELGLTPDAGRDAIRNVVDGLGDAARTSAQAAVGSVRRE